MNKTVAYLGPEGSFTHQAAIEYFGNDVTLINTPAHLIPKKVKLQNREGGCNYGILAAENIVHGFIESTFDALYYTADVQITGELYLPVKLNLITRATDMSKITHIFSHEAAISQCRKNIDRLEKIYGIRYVRSPMQSTSSAVEMASSSPQYAAIGSIVAANKYEIPILMPNFHDHPNNCTRFWVFSIDKPPRPAQKNKTVFLVEIESRAGTLRTLLNLFADNNVNITWLKPQIIPSQSNYGNWRYAFFIECEGHKNDENISFVYKTIRRKNFSIMRGRGARMIGSFPSFSIDTLNFSQVQPLSKAVDIL
jgi:chorismate mutase/prephenate dehydratase